MGEHREYHCTHDHRKREDEHRPERERGHSGHHGHHHHHHDHHDDVELAFAIVTCSDTRSMKEDTAGAALEALIGENGWTCASRVVVKDERADIAAAIVHAADELKVDIVLTCGGSGLSLRDVTPAATAAVCDRAVPGIAEAMRYHSLQITPFAMLSRARCMQRGRTIVINLPGSEKAARENWEGIVAALPHAAKMMAGGGH